MDFQLAVLGHAFFGHVQDYSLQMALYQHFLYAEKLAVTFLRVKSQLFNDFIELVHHLLLHIRQYMAIRIQRCLDVSMPEPINDKFNVNILLN